jgi:hypothetical protein
MSSALLLPIKENKYMNITIKNVSRKVTADSLAAIFSTYGQVTSTVFVSDESVAPQNKSALITMPVASEATRAIEQLNGCFVDGQELLIAQAANGTQSPLRFFYKRVRTLFSPKEKPFFHLI